MEATSVGLTLSHRLLFALNMTRGTHMQSRGIFKISSSYTDTLIRAHKIIKWFDHFCAYVFKALNLLQNCQIWSISDHFLKFDQVLGGESISSSLINCMGATCFCFWKCIVWLFTKVNVFKKTGPGKCLEIWGWQLWVSFRNMDWDLFDTWDNKD